MTERRDRQVRLAENESLFREINEHLQASALVSAGPSDEACAFLCECADAGCAEVISLTPEEYERVRRVATRFAIRPGHDVPDVERVVERHDSHWVVEKLGVAGEVVEELDPRDGSSA